MKTELTPQNSVPVCPVAGMTAFSVSNSDRLTGNTAGIPLPVLFSSPHSGTLYPETMRAGLRVPLMDLRRTEDAFVDELFAGATEAGATLISANYSRAYVDLNRDARELDPAMFLDGPPRKVTVPTSRVEAGLGCLPRTAAGGEPIYAARLSRAEGEYRLALVHDAYHDFLRKTLDQYCADAGIALLIDCHSMPSRQPGRRKLADIVLGDRFGSSCDNRLTSLVERTLRDLGYSVSRNAPYAGGYTTRCYGRPHRGVHALQIEINRKLYMDERNISRSSNFRQIKSDMQTLSHAVTAFARRLQPNTTSI